MLANDDLIKQLEKVAQSDADIIILREKDLSEEEYLLLASSLIKICNKYEKECILHTFTNVAIKLNHPKIHLPLNLFLNLNQEERSHFNVIGVSIHSLDEALLAEKEGATYITASHVFETKCKENLQPRGLDFLKEITDKVSIDVYALGGIHPDNMDFCIAAGADGICMMSEYMYM